MQNVSPLRAFFDLFNNRLITLLGLVYAFTQPELREAPGWVGQDERGIADPARDFLTEWSGLTESDLAASSFGPDVAARYAGLFALPSRPAAALDVLLTDYFGIPIRVDAFPEGYDEASVPPVARLIVGPLTWVQFHGFYPDRPCLGQLLRLARLYAGPEPAFEVELVLTAGEVPPLVLGGEANDPDGAALDWDAWLDPTPELDARLVIDVEQCARSERTGKPTNRG